MNDLLNPLNPLSPLNPLHPIWQSDNTDESPQQETLARIGEYDYSNSCISSFHIVIIIFIALCGVLIMMSKKN